MNYPLPTRPWSIAHRGASAYARANTLAAFRKAADLGADMWEVDFRVTADGAVVAFHDAELADGRTLNSLTRAELARSDPDIPDMEQVIGLAAELGAGLYADIKDAETAVPLLRAVQAAEIAPVILGAFDTSVVDTLREAGSRLPVAALVPIGADPHAHAKDADIIHLCWERLDHPEDTLTPDLFLRAFRDGKQIVLWHEEEPARMRALRDRPVTGICSDRPELVHPYVPTRGQPKGIVSHRGANKIAPENTLPALECALAAGFHIEVDLHLTADGEVVVIHDPLLERTTTGTGPVCDQTLAALRDLDAGIWLDPFFAGTRIPTLGEVFDLLDKYDGRAYLELKSAPPAPVLERVKAAGLLDRVFFWSFERQFLKDLRVLSSDARIMSRRQDYATLEECIDDYAADIVEFLPNDDALEIAALRDSGIQTMVAYNGDDEAVFARIQALQPDLVNLDQPFAFVRLLGRG